MVLTGPKDTNHQIGSFNLSSLDSCDPAFTPLLYRLREETFHNRTTQIRHGSYLRPFSAGERLNPRSGVNVDKWMHTYGLTGLIVVQNDTIRLEEYRLGNTPASRNDVQSVTKSVTSTALAIAHADGKIDVNKTVSSYVEELNDTAWADVPLLALLNMASGVVEPSDVQDPEFFMTEIYPLHDSSAMLDWLKTFRKIAEPWERFRYYNPNYYVLTTAFTRAIKEPVNHYITRNIWEPAGMQYDGYMRMTGAGQIDGHGGLSVTLTDMARFGAFLLECFKGKGGPAVPPGWFQSISEGSDSTGVRGIGANDVAPDFGYQNAWWTPRRGGDEYHLGDDKAFTALGMYGQSIYIIPRLDAIIATQSGYPDHSTALYAANEELVTSLVKALKEEAE